ncbi:MAG TPA: Hsp20/alpha crystallin family protein [Anaeromyxobacteraceae bacterium]|nr:Hsp20/alpha crystallin family protein [Anaeromyxobacteraceae bacterium]
MLTLWRTPENALASLTAEVDRLMNDIATPHAGAWSGYGNCPAADVSESDAAFLVTLDLPGHDPKAIELQVENDVLTVKSERKWAEPAEGTSVHRAERAYGAFFRSFRLPKTVDAGKVEARYEAGVLTVTLPKREEARPRTIAVQTA